MEYIESVQVEEFSEGVHLAGWSGGKLSINGWCS